MLVVGLGCTPLRALCTDLTALRQLLGTQGFLYSAVGYVLLFVVASLLLFPGSALVIAAGLLFGPVWGTLLSLLAATLASACAFLLARHLGRGWLLVRFGDRPLFQRIVRGIDTYGVDFLIFTRLVPLFPYNIQNYAYGLTAIGFWRYTLISALTLLPGTWVYSYLAATLAEQGITWRVSGELLLCGLLLFALTQAARRVYRRCLTVGQDQPSSVEVKR
ncbi:TVP38/TMEM64 family inner membrane protein ydjZ [Edwardsiella hoshinae]|uniref:TVP38/TMEM64 family inner membrane protein ydjZ n=1 Tax=Edwardsiella hoshinae TaxID=93378 RepID=A0A376DP87_9GAMM|nr:TVP38/TMEM64 family inner membrane protein ydjZ [Edwardsiella hoshinae]